ncbi:MULTISPECIES: BrnA antitoxin family protein [unclassified Devosia]|uniref:BrnA antitoxin family protein n=1 Tax=unclassified Devosia TaxID=196773 RepID=UPI0018F7291E|nr:BrnA antitoxin family protein [Devosia sp. MC532]
MTEQLMRRATLEELRAMKDRGEFYDSSNAPEGPELGDEFWKNAVLNEPVTPTSVHLKLDPEVFEFFKQQGKGHITRMQNVLAAYVKAQKSR